MSIQIDNLLKQTRPKMDSVLKSYEIELSNLRTGRASAALVENLTIEAYGVPVPIKQIAYISLPDAASIMISPYDKQLLKPLEESLAKADLGAMPVNIGTAIRISLPPLTEERRNELIKVAKVKAEEARIALRNVRADAWNKVQKLVEEKQVSEDDKYYGLENLKKLIEEFNGKIEAMLEQKEKEIGTI